MFCHPWSLCVEFQFHIPYYSIAKSQWLHFGNLSSSTPPVKLSTVIFSSLDDRLPPLSGVLHPFSPFSVQSCIGSASGDCVRLSLCSNCPAAFSFHHEVTATGLKMSHIVCVSSATKVSPNATICTLPPETVLLFSGLILQAGFVIFTATVPSSKSALSVVTALLDPLILQRPSLISLCQ